MTVARSLVPIVVAAVVGAVIGGLAFVLTGEAFWIGMGAAVAVVFWLAVGGLWKSDERQRIPTLALIAGMVTGVSLFAATEQPLWIGFGLSGGLLVGAVLGLWDRRSTRSR